MKGAEGAGPNPVTLLFRHVFAARARALFAGRSPVADLGATDLGSQRDLDGAFAGPGVLDEEGMAALGRALAPALRSGAPVLLCLPRAHVSRRSGAPLHAGTQIDPRSGATLAAALPRPIGLREARARLGAEFLWRGTFALGVILPAQSRQDWVRRHPQAFGVLAAAESLVRRWPLLRAAGDYVVIEGVRR